MADAGSGEAKAECENNTSKVHVFDFKFPSDIAADDLRFLITSNLVEYFGSPSCCAKNGSKSDDISDTNKKGDRRKKKSPEVSHQELKVPDGFGNVVQTCLNRTHCCLLMQNGAVYRATFKSSGRGSAANDVSTTETSFESYAPADGSTDRNEEQLPFQVASDESYARYLQRSLNTPNRRAYLSRSPIQTYANNTGNINSAPGPSTAHRDFIQANIVLNQPLHRLSPTLRPSRYMPYDRDNRPNRRHIQMGHLLNIPNLSRTLMYAANEAIENSSMHLSEESQMGLLDNITVVSLDSEPQTVTGTAIRIPSVEEMIPPIPTMRSIEDGVTEVNSQQVNALAGPSYFAHGDEDSMGASFNGTDITTVEANMDTNSNDSGIMKLIPPIIQETAENGASRKVSENMNLNGKESADSRSSQKVRAKNETERGEVLKEDKLTWLPEIGELRETDALGNTVVKQIFAMESAFLLIDSDSVLWFWYNDEAEARKASFPWNGTEKIQHFGCNLYRASVIFDSKTCETFYDKCFSDANGGAEPKLIKRLCQAVTFTDDICSDEIIDVQCSTFFTVIHTLSGKAYWWGLAPVSERTTSVNSNHGKAKENLEIQVGDYVSLSKQDKNEAGALVFNNSLCRFGVVLLRQSVGDSSHKIGVRCISGSKTKQESLISCDECWDSKDVVFLQEQSYFTGKVVGLDGPYAIVQHSKTKSDQESLKVYFKSYLEKVTCEHDVNVGRNRYQKCIVVKPDRICPDNNFTIAAVCPSEHGVSLLVNRTTDKKAFLIYPPSLNNHYSTWFTCGQPEISQNENLTSETNRTVEYEAVPSVEANLCVVSEKENENALQTFSQLGHNVEEPLLKFDDAEEDMISTATSLEELDDHFRRINRVSKMSRSVSLPNGLPGKRKMDFFSANHDQTEEPSLLKPRLVTVANNVNLLLDNKDCLYPIKFSCCLLNPPLLELLPMKTFSVFDRGMVQSKSEKMLTIFVVPKEANLTCAIRNSDKEAVGTLIRTSTTATFQSQTDSPKKKMKLDTTLNDTAQCKSLLNEYCSGNQNVMHVAVANIIKTQSKPAFLGSIMEIRNEEENAVLQMLLDSPKIWSKVRQLLCERDSHGCTPFMSAIIMQNLRGAYLILESVKRDGKNECKVTSPADKDLFQKSICQPTFSGLTPLHALIHNSSKKPASQQWYNTIKVSNLPPSYSSRLLLKLFKSHYPSVYRAIIPIQKSRWPQRSVRNNKTGERKSPERSSKKGKLKMNVSIATPQRAPTFINMSPRPGLPMSGRYTINRADILRANAKEGLVMFGDLNEMHQALIEMNNHSLLTKNDHPSVALLSVVQHLLHVQQYQESEYNDMKVTASKTHFLNSASSATPNHNDFSIEIGDGVSSLHKSNSSSQPESTTRMREDTISKCFDDIMAHLLMSSLVKADPSLAASGNFEGDSALSYFIKTYPRYSPSHLHKLYLNWRPCNRTNCKYNSHIGKLKITCEHEMEPAHSKQDKKKNSKEEEDKKMKVHSTKTHGSARLENPILARRGLQYRSNSLMLNVKNKAASSDAPSPITPSFRLLDTLKFAPIEVAATTGLTPKVAYPYSAVDGANNDSLKVPTYSPFFPHPIAPEAVNSDQQPSSSKPAASTEVCNCHLNKPRLLWNTTFEASVFYLSKSWPCLVGTIMQYKPIARGSEDSSELSLVESAQLDTFTENILVNPYNILLEVLIKTLMVKLSESKLSKNAALLSILHRNNPTDSTVYSGKLLNALLPWLTVQRFVRSLVRQLSLCLSKNAIPDGNLKYKIGRHANKSHSKKEARLKENLSLCLKAFSWISVVEILRAAEVMLKPIRSGTVKAQAKGIIRDIHHAGYSMGRSTLPSGVRMHIPTSGTNQNQRTFIRNASRRTSNASPSIPSSANSMLTTSNNGVSDTPSAQPDEDSNSDTEENHIHDPYMTETSNPDRNDADLNSVDWNPNQGITPDSSIAWAVDGHIRVRNEVSSRLIPPPGLWQFNQQNHLQQQIMNTPSIHAGYLYLARMFCRLVKEATDLARSLKKKNGQGYGPSTGVFLVEPMVLDSKVEEMFMNDAKSMLDTSWAWMKNALDTLESQLSVGEGFDTKHYVLRLKRSGQEGEIAGLGRPSLVHIYGSSPDEYMMYLLKQHMGEAENVLPVLDLFSYTHMTYILDAYIYINKHKPFTCGVEEEANEDVEVSNENHSDEFFKDAINLSSKVTDESLDSFQKHTENVAAVANLIASWLDESVNRKPESDSDSHVYEWNRVVNAFSTLFLTEGPGYERDSFLAVKAGASGRISRFKRSLSAVRGIDASSRPYSVSSSQPENPALLMNVVRSKLLDNCIGIFSNDMDNHPFGSLRVRFEGEEGTGPGVNRGLFAAFAKALKDGEKYAKWPVEFFVECGNLPAQRGVFTPKVGKYHCVEPPGVYFGHPMTQKNRYEACLAIGRFFGLTLWFNQNIPFIMSRPVLMYLLGRENQVGFKDLAYFDSALYKSFSNLMIDALSSKYSDEEFSNVYCFCFEINVDGHTEELCQGGQNMAVTKQNALKYVRLYTQHLLLTCRENELQGLRDGLLHMIPKELLDNLQPEDLQLLLSGGAEDVSYARLQSIISFSNSRGCTREVLERYKSWFWKIVLKMSSLERQKLLYFSTGSSVLPALDNRVGNNEELSITVDIINSTNNSALPMSSTCGQRISMPLYSTKSMLKQKLLQAVECQTYGLG